MGGGAPSLKQGEREEERGRPGKRITFKMKIHKISKKKIVDPKNLR